MSYRVEITAVADEDLRDRYLWVEGQAGTATADAYDERLRKRLRKLADFPNRGTPQPALPGLRSLRFERIIIVFYRVDEDMVTILRVVAAVRDLMSLFGTDTTSAPDPFRLSLPIIVLGRLSRATTWSTRSCLPS